MLLKLKLVEQIQAGEVTRVYRRWTKSAAKPGGRQRTPLGELAIDAVDEIALDSLTEQDAREGGYTSLAALQQELSKREGTVFRIAVRFVGEDPRLALREDVSQAALDEVLRALARKDARGAWTHSVLLAIQASPGTRAADLAEQFGLEKRVFKPRVRQLKELGLTISLDTGYRLSARGEAVLAAWKT